MVTLHCLSNKVQESFDFYWIIWKNIYFILFICFYCLLMNEGTPELFTSLSCQWDSDSATSVASAPSSSRSPWRSSATSPSSILLSISPESDFCLSFPFSHRSYTTFLSFTNWRDRYKTLQKNIKWNWAQFYKSFSSFFRRLTQSS